MPDDTLVVVDLKTCRDAGDESVQRAFKRYRYGLQLAAYAEGAGARTDVGYIVWQETVEPFLGRVSTVSADAMARGLADWRRAVAIWKRCLDSGEWPGYDDNDIL